MIRLPVNSPVVFVGITLLIVIRVPLILAGPGVVRGKVCPKPVQLMDVYPTLLEMAGLKEDKKLEGNSLATLLQNPRAEWPNMARTSFGPGNYSIRSERYRYIHYNDGSEEFFFRKMTIVQSWVS